MRTFWLTVGLTHNALRELRAAQSITPPSEGPSLMDERLIRDVIDAIEAGEQSVRFSTIDDEREARRG